MDKHSIETRAKQLKSEGYDFGQIRKYLNNEGATNELISEIFKKLDADEIHELRLKQKISQAKTQYYIAFVVFVISVIYNVIEYAEDYTIQPVTLIFPVALVIAAYYHLKSIKEKRQTMKSLHREEKRNSNKRYTFR